MPTFSGVEVPGPELRWIENVLPDDWFTKRLPLPGLAK
jgi:hypothetical protein